MWVGMGIRSWHRYSHSTSWEQWSHNSNVWRTPCIHSIIIFECFFWAQFRGRDKGAKSLDPTHRAAQHSHSEFSAWEGNEQLYWETFNFQTHLDRHHFGPWLHQNFSPDFLVFLSYSSTPISLPFWWNVLCTGKPGIWRQCPQAQLCIF